MNLNSINLNLLVTLDAIIEEQSLTKAARKLRISQPAISHMLKTLREIFEDDIIMKGPCNMMILTKLAKSLRVPLKEVLFKISGIFNNKPYFDPEYSKAHYEIGMTHATTILALNALSKKLVDFQNNIRIRIFETVELKSYDDFIVNNIDIAIGHYSISSQNILSEKLYETELVLVGNKDHDIFKKKTVTMKEFLGYPHYQIRFIEDLNVIISNIIKQHSKKRRKVVISVPVTMEVLLSLKGSNYLCITHKCIFDKFKDLLELDARALPFKTPNVAYNLYWKREDENNPSLQWIREMIKTSFAEAAK